MITIPIDNTAFKGTVVNRTLSSLHAGSLTITLYSPFKTRNLALELDINKVQVGLRITNDISPETKVDRQAYLKVAPDACIKEIEPLPPTQIF